MLYKCNKYILILLFGIPLFISCEKKTNEKLHEYVEYVDPLIDTHASRWFYFSSASRPLGMVNLSPDTQTKGSWDSGYRYVDQHIRTISHIHAWQLSGIPVLPITGEMIGHKGYNAYQSKFSHRKEIAKPGYHRFVLDDYDIGVELTSTKRVGFHRYHYPKSKEAHVIFDIGAYLGHSSAIDAKIVKLNDFELSGFAIMDSTIRRKKPIKIYFNARLNKKIENFGGWKKINGEKQIIENAGNTIQGPESGGFITFNSMHPDTILMKVAISYVSEKQAALNLEEELAHWNFDQTVKESVDEWNKWLSRIKVEGGTYNQRVKFYTDLWRSLLGRRTFSDVNGKYIDNTGPEPIIRQVSLDKNGKPIRDTYNSDSFWGAEWSISLLWSLAYPQVMNDFVETLIDYYKNGGLIARGPSGGNFTYVMVGDQAIPLIAAAYNKGIRNFDVDAAWEGSLKNAYDGGIRSHAGYEAGPNPTGGGMNYYEKQGWIPVHPEGSGFHREGAALTLYYSYQDWALSQFAKSLGKNEEHEEFTKRSNNWENLWDPSVKWIRPKNNDGTWLDDFSPITAGTFNAPGFVEGNSAIFSHYVPHNIEGLIGKFGTRKAYINRLNNQFEKAQANRFISSEKNHAESWIDYGNQPSTHMAHLFSHAGAPWLTQYWVRQVKELTFGDVTPFGGYNGDEDQGLMGSLGVLMAIGLFDIQGGASIEPKWEITTPLFERITIQLDPEFYDGDKFIIEVEGDPLHDIYIQSANLNGQKIKDKFWVTHEDIVNGGILKIEVGSKPNKNWGVEFK